MRVKGMDETVEAFNRLADFKGYDVGVWTTDPDSTMKLMTLSRWGYNFWHGPTMDKYVDQLAKIHLDWIAKTFVGRLAHRAIRPVAAKIGKNAAKALFTAIRSGVLGTKQIHGPDESNSYHRYLEHKGGGTIGAIGVLTGKLTRSLRGGVIKADR